MKVVTIATDLENRFLRGLLAPSCVAVGLDLTILRPADRSFPFNLRDKRAMLSRYLSELADRDELIVFTDAYDALFIRGAADVEAAYRAFDRPIVFSAELNSAPLGPVGQALYGDPVPPYPYLNSGGFAGRAGDILDCYARYPLPPSGRFELLERLRAHGYHTDRRFGWSDQYYWTLVHLLERDSIALDHEARLFECYGKPYTDVGEIMLEEQELTARGSGAPCYRREHTRLRKRLQAPSRSAQVHFNSGVSKTVALDLFDEGLFPDWLTAVLDVPAAEVADRLRVHDLAAAYVR